MECPCGITIEDAKERGHKVYSEWEIEVHSANFALCDSCWEPYTEVKKW